MDTDPLRERILDALKGIAPEIDPAALRFDVPLREQIDLDSMDWVTLLERVSQVSGARLDATRLGPSSTLADWLRAARTGATRRRSRHAAAASRAPAPCSGLHRLADGRRVRLRPIVEADAPRLAEFVRNLSPTTRYKRFMVGLRELPRSKLRTLTAVDQQRHIALAATEVGSPRRPWIGVARCVAGPADEGCEFALTVADDWQGTGLAGVLMRALMAAARAAGHRLIHGEVLAINRPMLTLARQLGFAVSRQPDDARTLRVQRAL